jgi:hypothetical protein
MVKVLGCIATPSKQRGKVTLRTLLKIYLELFIDIVTYNRVTTGGVTESDTLGASQYP